MHDPQEFFVTTAALARLETRVLVSSGASRLPSLMDLAWQLRQRDTHRALALAEEAESALAEAALTGAALARVLGRLLLLRAEAKWLFNDLDGSRALVALALQEFSGQSEGCVDSIGFADAKWLQACLAYDCGQSAAAREALEAMAGAARELDSVRFVVAQATLARDAAFKDVATAQQIWEAELARFAEIPQPAAVLAIEDFKGLVASLRSDHVESIRHKSLAYSLALDTGQLRRAIITATNIGGSFGNLNDHHAALEWMQRGLELARACGWPARVGGALMQTAETQRCLHRYDAAAAMLQEALSLLGPLHASRNYAIALHYLADVELDRKRYRSALEKFRLLEQRAAALDANDLLGVAKRGQAKALLELGEPEAALQAAVEAVAGATADPIRKIAALRVLAEIYARHPVAPLAGMTAENASLHCLQQAFEQAAAIENYTPPGDLFEAMAREYAKVGDTGRAYQLALQSIEVREKTHTEEASSRANAMHISHETEKARAESEHQRQLGAAHAERAEALERHNATLERLSAAGRLITGHLIAEGIYAALDSHVQALLGGERLEIYMLLADGSTLRSVYGDDCGTVVAPHEFDRGDASALVARCAQERSAVTQSGTSKAGELFGERLAAPLLVGERLLGVMCIQSQRRSAFAEHDKSIFKTLCAYGAVALANAETQALLIEQNRLLEKISTSDRLTGLSNRLHLDRVLQEEGLRNERYGSELSIILLDVDHFKSVNDTHGHQVGDSVLVAMAEVLTKGSRTVDVVGRWGGEEFLIICRETNSHGAMVLAEHLRTLIAAHDFPVVGAKTGSFGVASLDEQGGIEALIARADAALYKAKQLGRNQVQLGAV
ncbi:GGDEF domain-containing protein [Paucibacter sp. DJ4R-1]|nr:GGDEF domain-containing protein [Paucibacter sp. DJ4R-1]